MGSLHVCPTVGNCQLTTFQSVLEWEKLICRGWVLVINRFRVRRLLGLNT